MSIWTKETALRRVVFCTEMKSYEICTRASRSFRGRYLASVSRMFSAWDVGGEVYQAVDVPDTLVDRLGYVTLSGWVLSRMSVTDLSP